MGGAAKKRVAVHGGSVCVWGGRGGVVTYNALFVLPSPSILPPLPHPPSLPLSSLPFHLLLSLAENPTSSNIVPFPSTSHDGLMMKGYLRSWEEERRGRGEGEERERKGRGEEGEGRRGGEGRGGEGEEGEGETRREEEEGREGERRRKRKGRGGNRRRRGRREE